MEAEGDITIRKGILFGRSESSGLKPKEGRASNFAAEAPTHYKKENVPKRRVGDLGVAGR